MAYIQEDIVYDDEQNTKAQHFSKDQAKPPLELTQKEYYLAHINQLNKNMKNYSSWNDYKKNSIQWFLYDAGIESETDFVVMQYILSDLIIVHTMENSTQFGGPNFSYTREDLVLGLTDDDNKNRVLGLLSNDMIKFFLTSGPELRIKPHLLIEAMDFAEIYTEKVLPSQESENPKMMLTEQGIQNMVKLIH